MKKILIEEFKKLPESVPPPYKDAIDVDSIREEHIWIEAFHSDCEIIKQSLVLKDEKPFDIFTLKKEDGELIEVIFDISSFFRKQLE